MRRSFKQPKLPRTGAVFSWVLAAALRLGAVATGLSQIVTLSNSGSVVSINAGSQAGLYSRNVLAQGSPAQQWFWYRIGSDPQASTDTISAPTITLYGTREATISNGGTGCGTRAGDP